MRRPTDNKVVLDTSDEAATYRTDISGWVSRLGLYFGDGAGAERTAKYHGCTHVTCAKCGAITEKPYTSCRGCRDLAELARFEAMPEEEWDGKAMVYSQALDKYFNSPDDALDYLAEGQAEADLQLVICTPNFVRPLEEDYCCDELGEDQDLDADVAEAMATFNRAVHGIILSWSPGKKRLKCRTQSERKDDGA